MMKPDAAKHSTLASPAGTGDEFRAFFHLAGVGNAVVDVHTRKFVMVNRRFEEITGYNAEELHDRTFDDITHPDDRGRDQARFHELITGEHAEVKLEKRYVRKDGAMAWVHLTTTLLRGADGCPRLQLGVINDITTQKTAQAELEKLQCNLQRLVDERTAALTEKTSQLEGFVYTVAHDLRAPLRAINGYAEFVIEDVGTALSAGTATYLERIKQAARRMDRLIRDLLSYSRAAQVELKLEIVPLSECVEAALAALHDQIEFRNAEIVVDSPLPAVRGERGAIDQVIGHLLSNALKFVPPGKRPVVQVRAEIRGGSVRLLVTDNGIGIRPDFHDRVFGIFERLEDARSYPGTGIGLPIVRKTIDRLGGSVGLQSEVGKGSTFWFDLGRAHS